MDPYYEFNESKSARTFVYKPENITLWPGERWLFDYTVYYNKNYVLLAIGMYIFILQIETLDYDNIELTNKENKIMDSIRKGKVSVVYLYNTELFRNTTIAMFNLKPLTDKMTVDIFNILKELRKLAYAKCDKMQDFNVVKKDDIQGGGKITNKKHNVIKTNKSHKCSDGVVRKLYKKGSDYCVKMKNASSGKMYYKKIKL